ncbi:calcium/manganese antiporter SLC30A10 [Scleropages formosus]|uniref:Solute carrier family 30 member 10 n=1 Tax=Scleropages formosus TaxID=113540 RepID=A0A8C9VCA2_SCLFO|nr:zinc transporter 10 [Scleropages formosus]
MGRYTGKTCRLIFILVITALFFVAEVFVGYFGNSMSLVSDSFNMLSDLLSLCVGIAAGRVLRRPSSPRCTYGLSRAEVVGALANAVFLSALCFSVSVQSINRLAVPEPISEPELVLVVGALGLLVNIVGLLIFQDYKKCCWWWGCARGTKGERQGGPEEAREGARKGDDEESAEAGAPVLCPSVPEEAAAEKTGQTLNIRGVLLHVLNDTLGSIVVVVVSAVFCVLPLEDDEPCSWKCYLDPSLTLVMVVIIMISAVPLFKETTSILLQMTPANIQLGIVLEDISKIPGVQSIHEVHVWELAQKRNVATMHVKCADTQAFQGLSQHVRKVFHQAGVHSVTIQPEFDDGSGDGRCDAPCLYSSCQNLSSCGVSSPSLPVSNGHLPQAPSEVSVGTAEDPEKKPPAEEPVKTTKF